MKNHVSPCELPNCILCSHTLAAWHQVINFNAKNIQIKKGQQVFIEGDAVKGIYFVYSGTVKVHKFWDEEKEFIVRFAKSGDILGQLGLGSNATYPVSATALDKVSVCYLDMDFFESTLAVNPGFTYHLMRLFANELQEKDRKMRDLAHMSVKARIAQSFISLKDQFGLDDHKFIKLEISRQDLSAFSGVAYETFFKVMIELTEQKAVEAVEKRYAILNEHTLRKVIEDDQHKQALKKEKKK